MDKIPSPITGELVEADPRRFVSLRIRQLLATGESPLEFLIKQMQNTENSLQYRSYCAVQAAPYVHPRASPDSAEDPHEKFLQEIEGMRDKLASKIRHETSVLEAEQIVDKVKEDSKISVGKTDKK